MARSRVPILMVMAGNAIKKRIVNATATAIGIVIETGTRIVETEIKIETEARTEIETEIVVGATVVKTFPYVLECDAVHLV